MAGESILFKDSFPQFDACFAKVAAQGPLGLLDTSKPLGTQRVDVAGLRCLALTEIRADVEARVLDLPNFYDCRIENPSDLGELINEAIAAAGGKGDAGILDSLLSSIDDEVEGGNSGVSFLSNIVEKIRGGWPRQGTADRSFLESSVALSIRGADLLKNTITKHFPGANKYADDVQSILLFLVDTLFFIGDYVSTVSDVRKEMGVRVLSKTRVEKIKRAYKATYGTTPSMQTVSAWCAYGQRQGTPLSAPDGTTGQYESALASWKAKQKVVLNSWEKLRDTFGGDLKKYIACNTILASWYGTYGAMGTFGDPGVDTLIEEIQAYAQGKSPAVSVNASDPVMSLLAPVASFDSDPCGRPTVEAWLPSVVETGDPNAKICKTNYWIPFWEDRVKNFAIKITNDPGTTLDKRKAYRRSVITAMLGTYFDYKKVKKVVRPLVGSNYEVEVFDILNQWKIRDFAVHMKAVVDSWLDWAATAFPAKGKLARARKIKETLLAYWPAFNSVMQSSTSTAQGLVLFPFPTPTVNAAWFNGVSFVFNGQTKPVPEPTVSDPKFGGVKARCPGGVRDTSCLPGKNVLGTRRPIGAKPMQIPLLIEWGGQAGPLGSPEFAAWANALMQNGYPGYYIDYVAAQVAFVPKPGAGDISKRASEVIKPIVKQATLKTESPMLTIDFSKANLKGPPSPRSRGLVQIGGGGWKMIR